MHTFLIFHYSENPRFVESLKELESSPVCQSLKMQSFLMLPMQRITRLPLLIDAIFSRLDSNSSEFEVCREALEIINKVKLRKFLHFCYDLFSKFRQQRWNMWINSEPKNRNSDFFRDLPRILLSRDTIS